uniref:Uncharacterized protein n=1 Tax=Kalanchoe fedtschenkoi TaxID=63787 RepID=A0A7N0TD29_KALFE
MKISESMELSDEEAPPIRRRYRLADPRTTRRRREYHVQSTARVKVYRVSDDGKWDDQGTGHVTLDCLEGTDELGLIVVGEEESEILLMHSAKTISTGSKKTIIMERPRICY